MKTILARLEALPFGLGMAMYISQPLIFSPGGFCSISGSFSFWWSVWSSPPRYNAICSVGFFSSGRGCLECLVLDFGYLQEIARELRVGVLFFEWMNYARV